MGVVYIAIERRLSVIGIFEKTGERKERKKNCYESKNVIENQNDDGYHISYPVSSCDFHLYQL